MSLKEVFCLVGLFIAVNGAGEMTVLQSPESVVFSGDEELDLSSVKNVLSTALGFTIPETPRWSGMVVKNPFNFAEAAVVMAVGGTSQVMGGAAAADGIADGVEGSMIAGGGRSYSLRTDEPLRDTLRALQWRIEERFPTADNLTLVTVSLDDLQEAEKYFGDLTIRESPTLENLKTSVPEDKAFLDQIMLMDAITGKISSMGIKSDGIPDLYWFNLPGLHTLIDTYGEDSKQVLEAKRFLASSVLLLSDIFGTVYDEKVILVTLASDVAHTRRYKRTPPEEMGANTDETTSSNYAAIFNILLWFGVSFVFVLLAISIGIADMDPGRDSIIYRMTSNRMKKEN